MVKEAIQVYLRIRPIYGKNQKGEYELNGDQLNEKISIKIPNDLDSLNRKDNYTFKFRKIFSEDSEQNTVFSTVSIPVIENFLKGYNGTIFAYGQTGSGKTFTITGGAEKYSDRGIIPRTISHIFDYVNKHKSGNYTIQISYLEIYNENGYDLLDTKHDTARKLEDLNKVTLYEDMDANITLKNLSVHSVLNEEEALNLLFIGDTNRMVAETPMNLVSTRSHCIFTIHLTSRNTDSPIVTKSKIHLVDLAGSERVYKTAVDGIQLTEAKYINLSLHYLEQVIVALSEKKRSHIPYRNSMMTSILRDSLGGNCMTSMIANVSLERRNIMESISTCRFSQRVALIKNDAILNEDLDPQELIKQLKAQVSDLKAQLYLLQNEGSVDNNSLVWTDRELSEEIIKKCENDILNYMESNETEMSLDITQDIRKIKLAFKTMKELYQRSKKLQLKEESSAETTSAFPTIIVPNNPIAGKEVNQLRDIINQRDTEINILVSLLKKAKEEISDRKADTAEIYVNNNKNKNNNNINDNYNNYDYKNATDVPELSVGKSGTHETGIRFNSKDQNETIKSVDINKRILGDLSVGREKAFEIFKQEHELNHQMDIQKKDLRDKYAEAKRLGTIITELRDQTNHIKSQIGRVRIQNAITDDPTRLSNNQISLIMSDEEDKLRNKLEKEKSEYRSAYMQLRNLKTEIEHRQHQLETTRVQLAHQFEKWWDDRCKETAVMSKNSDKLPGIPTVSSTRYPVLTSVPSSSGYGKNSTISGHSSIASGSLHNIPFTGDQKVDQDIKNFIDARNKLHY